MTHWGDVLLIKISENNVGSKNYMLLLDRQERANTC